MQLADVRCVHATQSFLRLFPQKSARMNAGARQIMIRAHLALICVVSYAPSWPNSQRVSCEGEQDNMHQSHHAPTPVCEIACLLQQAYKGREKVKPLHKNCADTTSTSAWPRRIEDRAEHVNNRIDIAAAPNAHRILYSNGQIPSACGRKNMRHRKATNYGTMLERL
eukprot:198916-Pleurochrysis_carterae.AAC.2